MVMKVFVADFDLFKSLGGGQTFYRRIIETNPDTSFYYLVKDESPLASRPHNAIPVLYKEKYVQEPLREAFQDFEPPPWSYYDFVMASNIALSVANMQFDIVESPDYRSYGYFFADALRKHGVTVGKIVISMHGTLSTSHYHNWYDYQQRRYDHEQGEQWQYELADLRYALSLDYIDEWYEKVPARAHYLNPLHFVERPAPVLPVSGNLPPDLIFVGRTERRKGPHLFADIVAELPRECYGRAVLIGPGDGVDSSKIVYEYIKKREIDIQMVGPKSASEVVQLFSGRAINVVPSIYDSFNLVALESLFKGCPTAISTSMGVHRFLREQMPHLPIIEIDAHAPKKCVHILKAVLEHYDEYRLQLVSALESSSFKELGPGLHEIYSAAPQKITANQQKVSNWYATLYTHFSHCLSGNQSSSVLHAPGQLDILPHLNEDSEIRHQFHLSRHLISNYHKVALMPEELAKEVDKKLEYLSDFSHRVMYDRTRVWQAIARLELTRGNRLQFVTYALRAMRAAGDDVYTMQPQVSEALRGEGYIHEAETARAMYASDGLNRHDACRELLETRYARHLSYQPGPFSFIDENRSKPAYKVSVIVSLYNAAGKLARFISLLQGQTLIRYNEVEVIFVETGSPAGDYDLFRQLKSTISFPVTYARTEERETIQSAWNRGISLSRGDYLAFLGVDEYISPTCLEMLALELDRDPSTDWIIGNSLVTEVAEDGSWLKDVMMYDRTGFENGIMYLESCYLSYVGALYRKSIHTRFGFYDATFKGAGDTEFKCRVLPHIKARSVPHTLGYFMNYPDDRMTNSPRAEVEDLRAWYLHRTLAGVKYAFGDKSVEKLERMVIMALHYRKSYCTQMSSDVEYAYNLTQLLHEKAPHSPVLEYQPGIKKLLDTYRLLDHLHNLEPGYPSNYFLKAIDKVSRVEKEHRCLGMQYSNYLYRIFNDNRFEQHSWVWSRNSEDDDKYLNPVTWTG